MFNAPRRRMNYGGGGGQDGMSFAMLLLLSQMARVGFENIPPVTFAVLGICISIHLRVIRVLANLSSSLSNVCFSYAHFIGGFGVPVGILPAVSGTMHPLYRLFASVFFHVSDWHLYYNMVSWLYKARRFERMMGSELMFLWVLCAIVGTGLMYVVVCTLFGFFIHPEIFGPMIGSWLSPDACVVGFSGVIFCLKMVLNAHDDHWGYYWFDLFPIISQWGVWGELLLAQFITPNASFLGHLAGILAGYMFLQIDLNSKLRPAAESLKQFRLSQGQAVGGGGDSRRFTQREYHAREE